MSLPNSSNDLGNFKVDEERRNDGTSVVPNCIRELPQADHSRVPLTEEEMKQATSALLRKDYVKLEFPRKTKFRVDPALPGQTFGLISFIPAKGASPDKQGCFGVLKTRGTFPTLNEAERWAENIVRNYDSYAEIDITMVGRDFPLMVDNSIYCETTREIDIRKKVEETVKEHLKSKKEEERKEIEEIQDRQDRLLNEHKEQTSEPTIDIEWYTQLRVKKANAQHMLEECEKRMRECNEVISRTQQQIDEIDAQQPEFKDEFLQKYKNALNAIGADASKNPLIKYMQPSEEECKEESSSSSTEMDRSVPYPTSLDFAGEN
jgi:hypothetical protein